jgi:hypothetical protein
MKLDPKQFTLSNVADYSKAIMDQLVSSNATVAKTQEFLTSALTQLIDVVNKNGYLSKNASITGVSRFKSSLYNNLADYMHVDLSVVYNRLNGMVELLNTTRKSATYLTTKLIARMNVLFSRLRAMSILRSFKNEYDRIIVNTFSTDNNTNEDQTFSAEHSVEGNSISLNSVATDNIVSNRYNYDLYVNKLNPDATYSMVTDGLTSNDLSDGLILRAISKGDTSLTDYKVGTESLNGIAVNSTVTFPGIVYAIILDLPDVKFINTITSGLFGSGIGDLLGIYYAGRQTLDPQSSRWRKLDVSVDNTNINGFSVKFPGMDASSLMLVVGQRYYTRKAMPVNQYEMDRGRLSLKTLISNLKKLDVNNSGTLIKTYIPKDIAGVLSAGAQAIIGGLLGIISKFIPSLETTAIVNVNEYILTMSNLSVEYVHHQGASTFKSEYYGNGGNIELITFMANDNVPSGTAITYSIETATGRHRVIPYERKNALVEDIILISDLNGSEFETDFPFSTDIPPVVKLNDNDITEFATVVAPLSGVPVGTAVSINRSMVSLGTNDQLVIIYQPNETTLLGDILDPSVLDMNDVLGNPTFVNQRLDCKKNRVCLLDTNGIPVSFDMTTEIKPVQLPISGNITDKYVGYSIADNKGHAFSGANMLDIGGWGVTHDIAIIPGNYIYDGVFNEQHYFTAEETPATFREYVPGSLNVFSYNPDTGAKTKVAIDEYATDTSITIYPKGTFTAANGYIEGYVLCSYIPLSGTMSSNIAKYNQTEYFTHTDADGTVSLKFAPFVDTNIGYDSQDPVPVWSLGGGTFIYNANLDISYEPIQIMIKGYKALNMTDYVTGEIPTLDEFAYSRRNYQFYTKDNVIYFNTPIILPITISYYSRPDWFRVWAEMRRTNLKDDTISPMVYDYEILLDERET